MIIELNDRKIEESIKHLKKAIEIVGENELILREDSDKFLIEEILKNTFIKGKAGLILSGKEFELDQLLKVKTEFEKYFIKNKSKIINRVTEKIKEYNTELCGKIRKFKKNNSIEDFREILAEIEQRYKWEFDKFFLIYVDNISEEKNYYGEYLQGKKKQIIDSILVKLGI